MTEAKCSRGGRLWPPPRIPLQMCFSFFFFFYKFILFIYFWLCWVFVAARGLSLAAASRGCPLLLCAGFSCCRAGALGAWAQ